MQKSKQTTSETVVKSKERDYLHDCLHKASRRVIEWLSQFSAPVVVFETSKTCESPLTTERGYIVATLTAVCCTPRDGLMQRCVRRSRRIQLILNTRVNDDPRRGASTQTERAARESNSSASSVRFRITATGKQLCALCRSGWIKTGNVSFLENFPQVKKLGRAASRADGGPDSHGPVSSSGVTDAGSTRPAMEAQEELNSVVSVVPD